MTHKFLAPALTWLLSLQTCQQLLLSIWRLHRYELRGWKMSSSLHLSVFFLGSLSQGIIPQCHPWLYTHSPCPHIKATYTNQSYFLHLFQSIAISLFLVQATFTSCELFNSFPVGLLATNFDLSCGHCEPACSISISTSLCCYFQKMKLHSLARLLVVM